MERTGVIGGSERAQKTPARPPALAAGRARARRRVGSVRLVLALLVVAVSVGLSNFAASIGLGASGATRPDPAARRADLRAVRGRHACPRPAARPEPGRHGRRRRALGGRGPAHRDRRLRPAPGRPRDPRRPGRPADSAPPVPPDPPAPAGQSLGRLLVTGLALSMDNLVVGFAVGTFPVSLVTAVVVIAAVSVALSLVGLELGSRLGPGWEPGPAAGARSSAAWPSSASASRWRPACRSPSGSGPVPPPGSIFC